jgi:hypothetical protein
LVGEGTVFAVDIQEEMLAIIQDKMAAAGVDNVIPVLGEIDDPRLPDDGVGLTWVETKDVLPHQHIMVFEKPLANQASW